MRTAARFLLVHWLKLLSMGVLWRRKPNIVAVTGSVGKTTTKELTARMLAERYRVRASVENLNTEIGVPLTIFGTTPARRPADWWRITRAGFRALLTGAEEYPELLVLELSADKPGDLKHLTSFIRPDVSIVTNVREVHREHYDSVERIAEEKSWVVRRLKSHGIAVLNFDDTRTRLMQAHAPDRTLSYGFDEEANVSITDVRQDTTGQSGKLRFRDRVSGRIQTHPFKTALLGRHQLYGIMAAFAAAQVAEIDPAEALGSISQMTPPPGRLRVLPGRDRLTILDDSYNASPQAVLSALETLYHLKKPYRAVLGDMKELGPASDEGHRTVGEVAGKFLDELVVVGDDALLIAEAAKAAGMDPERIQVASDATEAAKLVNADGRGGTVLVKGSRTMHLERTVAGLLADPRDVKRLVDH